MNNLTYKRRIKDIKWMTMTSGILNPIFVLEKPITVKNDEHENDFDGIIYSDINILDSLCGVGSLVTVTCNEKTLEPTIDEVLAESNDFNFPTKCKVCKCNVGTRDGYIVCQNHLCAAKGESSFLKLVAMIKDSYIELHEVNVLKTYLQNFPKGGGTTSITNFYTWLKVFQEVMLEYHPEKREEELKAVFPREATELRDLEMRLMLLLKKGLDIEDFIEVMSLPFRDKDIKRLKRKYKNWLEDKFENTPKLTEHGRQVVDTNKRIIKLIITELNRCLSM